MDIPYNLKEGDLIHFEARQYDVETGRKLGGWSGTVSSLENLKERFNIPPHSSDRIHTVFGVRYVTRTFVCPNCYSRMSRKLPFSGCCTECGQLIHYIE